MMRTWVQDPGRPRVPPAGAARSHGNAVPNVRRFSLVSEFSSQSSLFESILTESGKSETEINMLAYTLAMKLSLIDSVVFPSSETKVSSCPALLFFSCGCSCWLLKSNLCLLRGQVSEGPGPLTTGQQALKYPRLRDFISRPVFPVLAWHLYS